MTCSLLRLFIFKLVTVVREPCSCGSILNCKSFAVRLNFGHARNKRLKKRKFKIGAALTIVNTGKRHDE